MDLIKHFINNLFTIPILTFVSGMFLSSMRFKWISNERINSTLILFLLFSIGLKGGGSLIAHSGYRIFLILILLTILGLVQPLFSYGILRKFTKIDSSTAVAIAACFGSTSVMTYVAGVNFLEKLDIRYEGLVAAALAIMEVPAIISGLFIFRYFNKTSNTAMKKLVIDAILNKTVLIILGGMIFGGICYLFQWETLPAKISILFKPILCLFLFKMGMLIGKHREDLRHFSWSLTLFGVYMPLIGAVFGILLSYFLHLSVGTGTLITVITASASYIAVPASMKIAIPEAKEAIYLPLSLGITFPFNVVLGIPLYYELAIKFLN